MINFRLGYNYNKRSRLSWGLTTLYKIQGQMENYEVLSRGSLFFLRSAVAQKKYHLVTTAHVTHPFAFRNLYPQEQWLDYLMPEDCKHQLQIREFDSGKVLSTFDIEEPLRHPSLDLAVMHLKNEHKFEAVLLDMNEKLEVLELDEATINTQRPVELHGHDFTQTSEGEDVLVPTWLPGTIIVPGAKRSVVSTVQPSVMGLCGGPAIADKKKCVGMVECLVSSTDNEMLKTLKDTTFLVTASQIGEFVAKVEQVFIQRETEEKKERARLEKPNRSRFDLDPSDL